MAAKSATGAPGWYLYPVRPNDTSEAAAELQARLQTLLTPGDRIRRAFELSDFAREFARASLRRSHPQLTEDQINRELVRQLYGDKKTRP